MQNFEELMEVVEKELVVTKIAPGEGGAARGSLPGTLVNASHLGLVSNVTGKTNGG